MLVAPVSGDEERDRVDPETVDAQLQPETDDFRDLLAHFRIGGVEVRLMAVLLVGEHVGSPVFGLVVAPDVVVAVAVVLGRACLLEPGVLHRGVVHDQVDDDAHPTVVGGADHLDEVTQVPVAFVDAEVVGDVVAVVLAR